MRFTLAVAFVLTAFAPVTGQNTPIEPFGLRMGTPRAELLKLLGKYTEQQNGQIVSATVPRPHPDFEQYGALASQTHGLCKVVAAGVDISLNAFGDRLKAAFNTIGQQLEDKYGKPETIDRLTPGSIWDKPEDWTMALSREERTLVKLWTNPAGANKTVTIALQARAANTRTGSLLLTYEAATFSACAAEITKSQRSVF
jgi:hypothetical protein